MSRYETLQGVFEPTPLEWQLNIAGRLVEITCCQERMKEDLMSQALERGGYDLPSFNQLLSAFSVQVHDWSGSADRFINPIRTKVVLAVPLTNSRFELHVSLYDLIFSLQSTATPLPSEDLSFFNLGRKGTALGPASSTDLIYQNTLNKMEALWRHEREHFLDHARLTAEEKKDINVEIDQREERTETKLKLTAIATGLISAFTFYRIRGKVDPMLVLASLLIANQVTKIARSRFDYLNYRLNPMEMRAFDQETHSHNLPGVFRVQIVEDIRQLGTGFEFYSPSRCNSFAPDLF